jgi:hypothetical protein
MIIESPLQSIQLFRDDFQLENGYLLKRIIDGCSRFRYTLPNERQPKPYCLNCMRVVIEFQAIRLIKKSMP